MAIGAAVAGAVVGGMFGRSSARKSMSFQREMAQKAHQYEVADLRAAGLNPILSGTGGGGARASGGAMPSTPDFAGAINSARKAKVEIANIEANTNLVDAKTDAIGGVSQIGKFSGDVLGRARAELSKLWAQVPTSGKMTAYLAKAIYRVKGEIKAAKAQEESKRKNRKGNASSINPIIIPFKQSNSP